MEPSVVEIDFGIRIIFLLSSSIVFDLYLPKSSGGEAGGSGGGVSFIFGFGLSGEREKSRIIFSGPRVFSPPKLIIF